MPAADPVVGVFASGTVVQVFLLARGVPPGTWSDGVRGKDEFNRPNLIESARAAGGTDDGKTGLF